MDHPPSSAGGARPAMRRVGRPSRLRAVQDPTAYTLPVGKLCPGVDSVECGWKPDTARARTTGKAGPRWRLAVTMETGADGPPAAGEGEGAGRGRELSCNSSEKGSLEVQSD
ncbi:hypothetical protein AAFF_G00072300 [Aldrovandia affinis]|uniref:Uncharacterized protein n=1 Tax=Aldrovandia affinis TaxID=143900 RepID=A0AAD7RYJ7_9TELE|nr:hypothetical protein AAFF_G00072300 [Aldrovandia affinis]